MLTGLIVKARIVRCSNRRAVGRGWNVFAIRAKRFSGFSPMFASKAGRARKAVVRLPD